MTHRRRTGQFSRTEPPNAALVNGARNSEPGGLIDGPHQPIRASDAERAAVAATLRQHAAEGRLTMQELEERLGSAYTATTFADLQLLLGDLPRLPHADPLSRVPALAPDWPGTGRGGRRPNSGFVILMALCWAIWAVSVTTSNGHSLEGLWPLWLMLPLGLAFLRRRPQRPTSAT